MGRGACPSRQFFCAMAGRNPLTATIRRGRGTSPCSGSCYPKAGQCAERISTLPPIGAGNVHGAGRGLHARRQVDTIQESSRRPVMALAWGAGSPSLFAKMSQARTDVPSRWYVPGNFSCTRKTTHAEHSSASALTTIHRPFLHASTVRLGRRDFFFFFFFFRGENPDQNW